MKRAGIVCAGNWIVDRIKQIDRWPEEGELCNIVDSANHCGGAANALFDLSALECGIPLYAVGNVGDDDAGHFLRSMVCARGLDDVFLTVDDSGAPTSFTDVMSCAGRRTFFHCRGANARFGMRQLEKMDAPAKLFYLAYLLLLDELDAPDAEYGVAAARALALMRERGMETVADIVSEAPEKFQRIVPCALPWVDHLIVNEVEAACVAGVAPRNDGKIDAAAVKFSARRLLELGVRRTVVIHFPEGAYGVLADGTEAFVPSFAIRPGEIAGSVGAGDAFCSGILYGLHENLPLAESMRLGAGAAHFNLRCATSTGGAPTLKKLKEFMVSARCYPVPHGF